MFLIGTILGSFIGLISQRLPLRQSIVVPRSHCEHCEHTLSFVDLIPIFSILFLRFRCRYCHTRIPVFYLVSEIAYGCLFWFIFTVVPINEQLLAFVWLTGAFILSLTDYHYLILEAKIFFPYTILLTGLQLLYRQPFYWQSLLFCLPLSYFVWSKKMGAGDLLLLLLWLPWLTLYESAWLLFIASYSGITALYIFPGEKGQYTRLPFVPFLSLALFIVRFYL